MSEVASNNIETNIPSQEKLGLMEAISARIKKVANFVNNSIKKVLDLGVDASKQLLDWMIPDSPVKEMAKTMIQDKPTPKPKPSSAPTTEVKKTEEKAAKPKPATPKTDPDNPED